MVIQSNGDGNFEVFDSKDNLFTSKKRIDLLFSQGYKFEACTSLSVLVDAYLTFIISTKSRLENVKISAQIDKNGTWILTAGAALKIIQNHNFIKDDKFIHMLRLFVRERNSLVHHIVKMIKLFDFDSFYALCNYLLMELDIEVRRTVFDMEKKGLKSPEIDKNTEK